MLASAIGLGIAAGLITGGRIGRLGRLRVAGWPVLLVAVLLRLAAGYVGEAAPYLYLVAFGGVVAVAVINRLLPGAWLIAAGSALNLIVVTANGAMPVSRDAVAAIGGIFPTDALHTELNSTVQLGAFADVIPIPLFRSAYSVGDVLIAAGGFWLTFSVLRRK